jgi:tetratricopeptide (TPR) repeat protein
MDPDQIKNKYVKAAIAFFCLMVILISALSIRQDKTGQPSILFKIFPFSLIPRPAQSVARSISVRDLSLSFDRLAKAIEGTDSLEEASLKQYGWYYAQIVERAPRSAEAYALLGFCQFKLNDIKAAYESYQRAVELNPDFFWLHYNLGLIYYKIGHFKEAADAFHQALRTDPQTTVRRVLSSKIYQQIVAGAEDFNYPLDVSLRQGYIDALYFEGMSLQAMGLEEAGNQALTQAVLRHRAEGRSDLPGQSINLKIF